MELTQHHARYFLFFQFICKFGCLPVAPRVAGGPRRATGAGAPGAVNRQAGGRGSGVAGPKTQKMIPKLYFWPKPTETLYTSGGNVCLTQR